MSHDAAPAFPSATGTAEMASRETRTGHPPSAGRRAGHFPDRISFVPRPPKSPAFVRTGGAVNINEDVDEATWRERFSALRLALNHPAVPVPARIEGRQVLSALDHDVEVRLPLPLFRVVVHVAGTLAEQSIRASEDGDESLARALTMLYRLTWPILSGGDVIEQRLSPLG